MLMLLRNLICNRRRLNNLVLWLMVRDLCVLRLSGGNSGVCPRRLCILYLIRGKCRI